MNKKITISLATIVALILGVVSGFFIGRSYTPEPIEIVKEIVKYEKLPADTIKISYPEPYKVYDTITDLQTIYVDTAKSIDDYFKVREYHLDFSKDSLGSFIVDARVHKNSLLYAEAQIEPIIKTVTIERTKYTSRTLQVYTIIGTSLDLNCNKIQAGIDLKNKYMIGASGVRLGKEFGYTVDFGIKF